MAPIEPDGDADHAREHPHQVLGGRVKRGELAVAALGGALAVVAGDLGDELDLVAGETHQVLAVADQIGRVQMVPGVGDGLADVGEQRPGLQIVEGRWGQLVQRSGLVEQLKRHLRRPAGVGDVGLELIEQMVDAGPS